MKMLIGVDSMTNLQKAKMILAALEEYVQIDAAFEDYWLAGVLQGLENINDEEKILTKKENKHEAN